MLTVRITLACVFLAMASAATLVRAEDLSLLPKYGSSPKTDLQRAQDDNFHRRDKPAVQRQSQQSGSRHRHRGLE